MAVNFRIVILLLGAAAAVASTEPVAPRPVLVPPMPAPAATTVSSLAADPCSTIEKSIQTRAPAFPSELGSWYTSTFEKMPGCNLTVPLPTPLVSLAGWWNCANRVWSTSHSSEISSFQSQCSAWLKSSEAASSATNSCQRWFQFDEPECTDVLGKVTNTAPASSSFIPGS